MKITILQRDIVWADPAENRKRCDEAISRNHGSDLYVLPEMFSTGFCTHPEGIAESVDSDTLKWMKDNFKSIFKASIGVISLIFILSNS